MWLTDNRLNDEKALHEFMKNVNHKLCIIKNAKGFSLWTSPVYQYTDVIKMHKLSSEVSYTVNSVGGAVEGM